MSKATIKDLRLYQKESNTHEHFLISSRYQEGMLLTVRGVRSKVCEDLEVYDKVCSNTRYYSVVNNGVIGDDELKDRFNSIQWDKYYFGASCPTLSIGDVVAIYRRLYG